MVCKLVLFLWYPILNWIQGCDFCLIEIVILWNLPPSFCTLAQRAGRAAQDMEKDGIAILFISSSTLSKGVQEANVDEAVAKADLSGEAENRDDRVGAEGEEEIDKPTQEDEVTVLEEVGVRVVHKVLEEGEGAELASAPGRHQVRTKEEFNSREAHYLSLYVAGLRCRRAIWNKFFGNT